MVNGTEVPIHCEAHILAKSPETPVGDEVLYNIL
tara:strand:+ start:340 stop:441 length:102 start_codon:yes stop_codon:yes gene_type:complete